MTHQRTTRQETMLAVIQMQKRIEKYIDRHTLADKTELGVEPTESPYPLEQGSPYQMASTVPQIRA